MTRIILVSGKGGVGKTTVAAATAVAASAKGYKTLVLSFDLAHSLSDSFDLGDALFDHHAGEPVTIRENLDLQEIDIQQDLDRHWGDTYKFSAAILGGSGLSQVASQELGLLPGIEDLVALMCLNQHLKGAIYDVIVLDSPPTSESLRFVNFSTTIDWYARKRLGIDRRIAGMARPIVKTLNANQQFVPEDSYYDSMQHLFERLQGVDQTLRDPAVTTVRLVSNPEKMVVRETQRAFMYFNMYGMTTDQVVLNRIFPKSDGYLQQWAELQSKRATEIQGYFEPVPVVPMPYFPYEIVGLERLGLFARQLYGDTDPTSRFVDAPAYGFKKVADGHYTLTLHLPFSNRKQIKLSRQGEDLTISIGTFRRNVLLPRKISLLPTRSAAMDNERLVVHFGGAQIAG